MQNKQKHEFALENFPRIGHPSQTEVRAAEPQGSADT